jgi:hypothetical protein
MTDTILYGCNADGAKDLCTKQATSDIMRMDAMPAPGSHSSTSAAEADTKVSCNKMDAVHDTNLTLHIDAFTHGQYTGAGITQKEVGEMLHSNQFSAHEKAELRTINKMLPEVADLFKSPDVSRAKMGAFIAWECPQRP